MKPVEITLFDDVLYDDGCSALAGKYAAFKLNKTTIFVDKSHVAWMDMQLMTLKMRDLDNDDWTK